MSESKQIFSCLFLCCFCIVALTSCSSPKVKPAVEIDAALSTEGWLREKYGVVQAPDVNLFLARLSKRLASSIQGVAVEDEALGLSDEFLNRGIPFQVLVINTLEPNAFSLGGGIIVITRGLMQRTASEAELATVIAHEMAHQVLGHVQEAMYEQGLTSNAPTFSFTLDHELDADALSLKILKVARYDIREAPHALTIAYRPLEEVVPVNEPDWLGIRLAYLHQKIDSMTNYLPATQTTREFTRVRKRIL